MKPKGTKQKKPLEASRFRTFVVSMSTTAFHEKRSFVAVKNATREILSVCERDCCPRIILGWPSNGNDFVIDPEKLKMTLEKKTVLERKGHPLTADDFVMQFRSRSLHLTSKCPVIMRQDFLSPQGGQEGRTVGPMQCDFAISLIYECCRDMRHFLIAINLDRVQSYEIELADVKVVTLANAASSNLELSVINFCGDDTSGKHEDFKAKPVIFFREEESACRQVFKQMFAQRRQWQQEAGLRSVEAQDSDDNGDADDISAAQANAPVTLTLDAPLLGDTAPAEDGNFDASAELPVKEEVTERGSLENTTDEQRGYKRLSAASMTHFQEMTPVSLLEPSNLLRMVNSGRVKELVNAYGEDPQVLNISKFTIKGITTASRERRLIIDGQHRVSCWKECQPDAVIRVYFTEIAEEAMAEALKIKEDRTSSDYNPTIIHPDLRKVANDGMKEYFSLERHNEFDQLSLLRGFLVHSFSAEEDGEVSSIAEFSNKGYLEEYISHNYNIKQHKSQQWASALLLPRDLFVECLKMSKQFLASGSPTMSSVKAWSLIYTRRKNPVKYSKEKIEAAVKKQVEEKAFKRADHWLEFFKVRTDRESKEGSQTPKRERQKRKLNVPDKPKKADMEEKEEGRPSPEGRQPAKQKEMSQAAAGEDPYEREAQRSFFSRLRRQLKNGSILLATHTLGTILTHSFMDSLLHRTQSSAPKLVSIIYGSGHQDYLVKNASEYDAYLIKCGIKANAALSGQAFTVYNVATIVCPNYEIARKFSQAIFTNKNSLLVYISKKISEYKVVVDSEHL